MTNDFHSNVSKNVQNEIENCMISVSRSDRSNTRHTFDALNDYNEKCILMNHEMNEKILISIQMNEYIYVWQTLTATSTLDGGY